MSDLAGTFQYEAVAEAYQHRPPYPDEVFDRLAALITDEPRTVLDIGAGEERSRGRWRRGSSGSTRSTSLRRWSTRAATGRAVITPTCAGR